MSAPNLLGIPLPGFLFGYGEPDRKVLALAGPSGVGKGTMIDKLKAEFPGAFSFSVRHTGMRLR